MHPKVVFMFVAAAVAVGIAGVVFIVRGHFGIGLICIAIILALGLCVSILVRK